MHSILLYLRNLPTPKQVLWCYLIWYLVMAGLYFDGAPALWLTSLGISVVIGLGLILSVAGSGGRDAWSTARLFMMPFCVSSFSALVKNRGFVLIVSPRWQENVLAIMSCVGFISLCALLRASNRSR